MNHVSRREWKAEDAKGHSSAISDSRGISVHLVRSATSDADAVRALQKTNMRSQKDIAFNWVVTEDGSVYEGRGWGVRPTANGNTRGNKHYHAVAFLGSDLTEAAKAGLKAVITESALHYGKEIKTYGKNVVTNWVKAGMPVDRVEEETVEEKEIPMDKLNDPVDEEIFGEAPVVEEGESLPDLEEIDPNELYAADEQADSDPVEGDEDFDQHIAEVDQDLGDVPEGSDEEIIFFGDDDDFDPEALLEEESEDQ